MVFDFTQFWLDGRPGNEYFWISHKISDLLTPLRPLDLYPQCLLKMKSETDWSNSSQCALGLNVNFSTLNKLEIPQLENFDAWFVSLDQWQPTQVQMTNIFESKQADTY